MVFFLSQKSENKKKIKKIDNCFSNWGEKSSTKALQSTPFQNPVGVRVAWVWQSLKSEVQTEILVSNIGHLHVYSICSKSLPPVWNWILLILVTIIISQSNLMRYEPTRDLNWLLNDNLKIFFFTFEWSSKSVENTITSNSGEQNKCYKILQQLNNGLAVISLRL